MPQAVKPASSSFPVLLRLVAFFRPAPRTKPVITRPAKASNVGRGFVDPRQKAGVRRIVVTVDDGTFDRIHTRAVEANASAAEVIRQLIERGFAESAR